MKIKWLIYSISGLLLIGFGLSLLGEAIIFKMSKNSNWFYMGTLALIIFNSGICIVAEATLILYQVRKGKKT
jgi:hypothetical protein|tara:strand:+ start:138 stop:353 length:216 start_codon:yes stop_codon:yes gene_type:complete